MGALVFQFWIDPVHVILLMHSLSRAMATIGIVLIALPATDAICAPMESQSPSTNQATVTGKTVPEAPAVTEDGTPATVIDDREVEGVLGKSVRSNADEDMGQIIDVIVKRDGRVRAAVIDFGGFLGVGSRKIAVDWSALSFPPSGTIDHVILNLTRDQVRLAPEYRPGEPVVVLGAVEAVQPKPDRPAQTENLTPEK
jgi:PRC-barrel domain